MQEPQAGCGLLALCCAFRNRTLRWFLVFNGDRLDKLTDYCSGECEDNQGQFSRGSWGSQTGARSPRPSRPAPGSQAQQLEHCCPLVVTSAPGKFSLAWTCLSFPVDDRHVPPTPGPSPGLHWPQYGFGSRPLLPRPPRLTVLTVPSPGWPGLPAEKWAGVRARQDRQQNIILL